MTPPSLPGPANTPPLPSSSATYPIRAVSLMVGVSIDTLRAWERRYKAVTPARDGRGRVYSDADVRRIRLLHGVVEKGHAIGRVAQLTNEQLERLGEASAATHSPVSTDPATGMSGVAAVIAAVERFDAAAVEHELARAAAMLPASTLLRDLVVPVLVEVGERWHDGRAQIAHEHLLSASVRNVLGSLLRLHQKAGARDRLLFATPSGESHEFGALGAAVIAASGGLGTIYLGPGLPADQILAVPRVVQVDVVVLGITSGGDAERAESEVSQIAAGLPKGVELWLGGAGAGRVARTLNGRALVVPTYEVLEQMLLRIDARG
ncbi:MAG: MerR family transcriptional regulator [Vicinamibacterales bacterium]